MNEFEKWIFKEINKWGFYYLKYSKEYTWNYTKMLLTTHDSLKITWKKYRKLKRENKI